MASIPGYTIV